MNHEPSTSGPTRMGKQYTVSDGKMILLLEEAEEGGFVVTSPLDPGLVTQAETLQEAFLMAYDAAECLAVGRKNLAERLRRIDHSAKSGANRDESLEPGPSPRARSRKKDDRALKQ
jgi:antitoxin HicB